MATYVTLVKFTEKGVKSIKDSCKRAAEFKANAAKRGIQIKDQLWCMGAYDGALVYDAPNDEAATAAMLGLSSQDNVSTQTMRAFNADEMAKVIGTI